MGRRKGKRDLAGVGARHAEGREGDRRKTCGKSRNQNSWRGRGGYKKRGGEGGRAPVEPELLEGVNHGEQSNFRETGGAGAECTQKDMLV